MSRWSLMLIGLAVSVLLTSRALGQQYFALSGTGVLYEGDLESGELHEVGDTGIGGDGPYYARSVEFTQDGRLLVMGEDIPGTVFVIDPTTADATAFIRPVDDAIDGALVTTMASASDRMLYVLSGAPRKLFAYDESSGEYQYERSVIYSDQIPPDGIGPVIAIVERDDGRLLIATVRWLNLGEGYTYYYLYWSLDVERNIIEPLPADPVLANEEPQAYFSVYRGEVFFTRKEQDPSSASSSIMIDRINPYTGERSEHAELSFPFAVLGFQIVPENPADRALPHGELDVSDAISFLVSFSKEEAEADLAAPYGVHDYEDVIGFLHAFERGYP